MTRKTAILITAALVVLVLLFPPYIYYWGNEQSSGFDGLGFILSEQCLSSMTSSCYKMTIYIEQLLVHLGIGLGSGVVLIATAKKGD